MKNLFIHFTIAASFAIALCSGTINAHVAVPEGYKTIDFPGFTVSIPGEFEKSDGWSSESQKSFNSNAVNVRDDGDEYLSSATINVYETEGEIDELNDFAQNMAGSARAMDEVCDEPIIEGNTIIMHSTSEVWGGNLINWRFIVINNNGKVAGGTISYHSGDAKFYEGIVAPIIQSIQFK